MIETNPNARTLETYARRIIMWLRAWKRRTNKPNISFACTIFEKKKIGVVTLVFTDGTRNQKAIDVVAFPEFPNKDGNLGEKEFLIFEGKKLHIIKPLERDFWLGAVPEPSDFTPGDFTLRSISYRDAAAIVFQVAKDSCN